VKSKLQGSVVSAYQLMCVVIWSVRREETAGGSGKERSMAAVDWTGLSVDRAGNCWKQTEMVLAAL
jgi:hypothetical protein